MTFHNLKIYDAHHIMQELRNLKDHRYEVIRSNLEKYVAFSLSNRKGKYKIPLHFIDSLNLFLRHLKH